MFRIAPGGVGCGRIEQLSSFAIRYAEEMAVQFVDLYRELVAPQLYDRRERPARFNIVYRAVVEGITKSAVNWTSALEKITSVADLSTCTLLPFAGVIGARRLVSVTRRWCPSCLAEMAKRDSRAVYEPLVWRLQEVRVCARHKRALMEACPVCGKGGQLPFIANARVGCCRHCGVWMGDEADAEASGEASDFEIFAAEQGEHLLTLPAQLSAGARILPSDVAVQALRDVFFCGNGAEMARAVGELPSQANGYAIGEFPAPLSFYTRAAYVTGASMYQIFVSNDFDVAGRVRPGYTFDLRRAQSRRAGDQAHIERALSEALIGGGIKSVRAVAIDLCMEPPTIWRRSPHLCSELSRRHALYVASTAAARRSDFEAAVREVLSNFAQEGVAPSANQMREALNDPACFLNDWKRAVIRIEMAKFDW
jgi:hypothetical protein